MTGSSVVCVANLLQGLDAVHHGHFDIHQYGVGMLCESVLYRLLTVLGPQQVILFFEDYFQQFVVAFDIFRNQYQRFTF